MKENVFGFYKRALLCFLLSIVLFMVSAMRVVTVATTDFSDKHLNGIKLTVGKARGTIFDCNGVRLTNSEEKIIASVSPTSRAKTVIKNVLKEKAEPVLKELEKNKPVLCEVPKEINCDGIISTTVYSDKNTPTRHIIGYTDTDSKGVSGLQKAYDSLLYSDEEIYSYYETDAKGRILKGVEPVFNNPNTALKRGVVSTIDINFQTVAENYASHLERGAVVIAEAETGKIKACVSRPQFDEARVEIYLNSPSSPLLNRCLNAYNVGSVFKPLVALVGIENGFGNFIYNCTGSCEIIDRYFKCHKLDGHKSLELNGAIANSCNTYFYNLAFKIGGEKIYKSAKALSLDRSLRLCQGIETAKGNLPQKETLENIAHLANFSIGQGELLLSPVSILTLYCAIATDGSYYLPSLVEGTMENGSFIPYDKGAPTKVFNEENVKIIREYLKEVLTDGTGKKAKPKTVSAAGKTATAQTGKFQNGKEISEGWFCGFFPAESPEYVVIVFSEDDTKQTLSCGEIFAKIADGISAF